MANTGQCVHFVGVEACFNSLAAPICPSRPPPLNSNDSGNEEQFISTSHLQKGNPWRTTIDPLKITCCCCEWCKVNANENILNTSWYCCSTSHSDTSVLLMILSSSVDTSTEKCEVRSVLLVL